MDMAHIIQPHNSGQRSRTLYGQPIIKHLDLDIRPLDAVISMLCEVNSYAKLLPNSLVLQEIPEGFV